MAVDRTDTSVANDYGLKQREKSIRVMAGYDPNNNMVREVLVNSQGGLSTVGGNGVSSDLTSDAWGRPISVLPYSIFHSMWNYDVNPFVWIGRENGTEVDITASSRIISTNGSLEINTDTTNGNYTDIRSFRSPRYQPDRGHRWSTSIWCPNYDTVGHTRRFGIGTADNGDIETGVYFELKDGSLYAVLRSNSTTKEYTDITSNLTDNGIDISDLNDQGLLFDIEFQWRGQGDYFMYVNLKLVYAISINPSGYVTMDNPQLPTFYQAKNISAGSDCIIRSGCVDITSEGGQSGDLTDASKANTGVVAIPNDINNHHLLIFRVSDTYKTKTNTRNFRLLRITTTAFGKDMITGFSITRDATAIAGTTGTGAFTAVNAGSSLEVIDMSQYTETEVSFDFSKATIAYQAVAPAGTTQAADEPNPDLSLYFAAGDIIVLYVANVKSGTGGEAFGLCEFGEEI